jgi:hypothetical protein
VLHVYILAMLFIEIVIVVALIVLNGVLAMAELAVVSSRRARLQARINREVVGARRALALASDPGKFLSTVQIGITLNGVLSGAFSGGDAGTAACAMVRFRRHAAWHRGNRRCGIGGGRDYLRVLDRRRARTEADCAARP